jgi:hypothetical protein
MMRFADFAIEEKKRAGALNGQAEVKDPGKLKPQPGRPRTHLACGSIANRLSIWIGSS